MDAPLDTPLPPLPYDGERRRAFGEYPGAERRLIDPATEQDHPELFYPQADEVAVDPQQPAG